MDQDKSGGGKDPKREVWRDHVWPALAAILMAVLFSLVFGALIRLRAWIGYSVYSFEQAVEALYSMPLLAFVFLFALFVLGISNLISISSCDRVRSLAVPIFEAVLGLVVTLSGSIFGVVIGVLPYASEESKSATPYVLVFAALVVLLAAISRWKARDILSAPVNIAVRRFLGISLVVGSSLLLCLGPWPDRPAKAEADQCVPVAGSV